MKKYTFILLVSLATGLNAQKWEWAINQSCGSKSFGTYIGNDLEGNIYVTASADGQVRFLKFDQLGNLLFSDSTKPAGKRITDSIGDNYSAGRVICKNNKWGNVSWMVNAPGGGSCQNIVFKKEGGIAVWNGAYLKYHHKFYCPIR